MTTEAFVTRIWDEFKGKRLQQEGLRPFSYAEKLISEPLIPICQDSEGSSSKDSVPGFSEESSCEHPVPGFSEESSCEHSVSEYPELESSLPDYGRRRGWLEDKDATGWKKAVERRDAARIIHEFLRRELKEKDENDWQGAEQLKDLYDCHICVNHVAQVYAKGIMEPAEGRDIFGMRRELTEQEAELIVLRIFSREKRKPPQISDMENRRSPQKPHLQCRAATGLSKEEALRRFSEESHALLIDVRIQAEYEEEHLTGAICVPMAYILRNPRCIIEDYRIPLFFYCGQGYQSEVAANCAAQAGYENVFYFGLEECCDSSAGNIS